ncbi:hypothetical protein [Paractinoplanes rishiriensis]|uniref:Galactose oxidase n=1 Tax=Paractinoplanes rishiriensis TaxID=1050105 RepID=A0A919JVN1_9ACTN|nr:hypothetical protein [Actinoplanes rishiriensis]GIE95683.1 hypothetical protein Ari01nite_31480 [Actinoplanes rishiriensis]
MRTFWRITACGLLLLGGCASVSFPSPPSSASASWREMTGSPLSPREQTLGLWTGSEVLLIGGSDDKPCPPNADCPPDPTPLTDGAALNPATGTWRKIADTPVGFTFAQGVVVAGTAYVRPPYPKQDVLLAYRIDQDRWERRSVPFDPELPYHLVAAGDRLVAVLTSDENGTAPDYLFEAGRWTPLPDDPLGRAFGRMMVWDGREMVLFDHELIPNPGAEGPSVVRAAALDLATGKWRTLPASQILSSEPWFVSDGKLVNPILGGADGGEVGNWGRTYPDGGILDPSTGTWSALPAPPFEGARSAGGYGPASAAYLGIDGLVLNAATGKWEELPLLPGADPGGHTVVAAGTGLVVFGGAISRDKLTGKTWYWSPA